MSKFKLPALAGMIAGVVMSMFEMIVGIFDKGFWAPVRGIAAVFGVGVDTTSQYAFSLAPVLTGLVIHMAMSMMLGIVFFVLFHNVLKDKSFNIGMMAAMVFGFFVYVVMFLIVLPLPVFSGGQILINSVPGWAWILGHLMFGVVGYVATRMMKNKLQNEK